MKYTSAAFTLPSNPILRMRVRFEAGTVEGYTITSAYIGHRAASGDAYDFSTTPVQLLFSGNSGVAISSSSTATSDWATFAYDKTSDLLIACYINGGASVDTARAKSGLSNTILYYMAISEAATVNKSTGYSVSSGLGLSINFIEVETSIIMAADSGSFALTGQTSSVLYGRLVSGGSGSYSYTGQTISMIKGLLMSAVYGLYTYTGYTLIFNRIRAFLSLLIASTDTSLKVLGQDNTITISSTDVSMKVRN